MRACLSLSFCRRAWPARPKKKNGAKLDDVGLAVPSFIHGLITPKTARQRGDGGRGDARRAQQPELVIVIIAVFATAFAGRTDSARAYPPAAHRAGSTGAFARLRHARAATAQDVPSAATVVVSAAAATTAAGTAATATATAAATAAATATSAATTATAPATAPAAAFAPKVHQVGALKIVADDLGAPVRKQPSRRGELGRQRACTVPFRVSTRARTWLILSKSRLRRCRSLVPRRFPVGPPLRSSPSLP